MAFWFYKPGQGYWTRTLSMLGAMVLVVCGAAWLWNQFSLVGITSLSDDQLATGWTKFKLFVGMNRIYFQAGIASATIAVFGGLLMWILNKPRIVDFMIATEAEMRKVNWPSRSEIIGSTWVVIGGTFLMALLLFVVDLMFSSLFQWVGILEGFD